MVHFMQELGAWDRTIAAEGVHHPLDVTEKALLSIQRQSKNMNADQHEVGSGRTRKKASRR